MKTLFIITLCLPLSLSAQQWSGSANTASTISRTGQVTIDNTTTVRRLHINTNTVTNTPDISLSAQAMIETESNMFLNIDSDNNTNNAALTIGKNSPTTTGYTPLFKVHEGGNAYLYSGHYRTYDDGGLYNQTDGTYFYSDNANYFRLRSDKGLSIASRNNTRMGTIYHNNNNAFGLLDGDGNWVFRSQIDDNIGFYVDNDLKMSIMNSGNIGIGTDNPQYKLDVSGPARIKQVSIGGNSDGSGFHDGVTGQWSLQLNAAKSGGAGGDIVMRSEGEEKMIVKSNGNVGIGTNNPTHKLTVESGSGGGLLIKNTHGNSYLPWTDGRAYLAGKEIVFRTDNNTDRMRITQSGNVGIGIDNPNYQLQVGGSARLNSVLIGTDLNGTTAGFANHVAGVYSLRLRASRTNGTGGLIIFDSGTSEKMRLNTNGQLLINTTSAPTAYKLGVDGKIICEGMRVRLKAQWADYVFDEDYDLMPLEEVETHIKENKHLPGVPSAKEVAETGLDIEIMQVKMMEKIEELTLHIIEQDKQIKAQQVQINELMTDK